MPTSRRTPLVTVLAGAAALVAGACSGGSKAATPTTNPIMNFARPAGINNPAGFGGTPSAGRLLQVGGAQNTMNSSFAPYPIGTVITGVGLPAQPATR